MISKKELNPKGYDMGPAVAKNFEVLYERMNEVRRAYGKPMIVTSGLRSDDDQERLRAQGRTRAVHSKHIAGAACDILDKDGQLAAWCLANEDILRRIGLWCEHPDHTPGWVHFQTMAPKSGRRFFIP
jgi:hypothetical protein